MQSLETLRQKEHEPKYLAFWGHTPRVQGQPGPHLLSQWYPSPFVIDGLRYATAEHYMMAEKARLFEDHQSCEAILKASHPNEAKSLGRQILRYDDEVWETHRFEIVVRGNTAKFSSDSSLRDYLLGTGDRVLVEASPTDRIWGIGLAASDPRVTQPEHWQGLNLLGFALMEARDRIRLETTSL